MSDFETGMRTRREVLGDEHVDRATANAGSFGAPWQEFITRYAWGGVWSRPGLDRRMRSVVRGRPEQRSGMVRYRLIVTFPTTRNWHPGVMKR